MPLLYIYQRKEMEIKLNEQEFAYQRANEPLGKASESNVDTTLEYRFDPNFEEMINEIGNEQSEDEVLTREGFEAMSIIDKLSYSNKRKKENKIILKVKEESFEGQIVNMDSGKVVFQLNKEESDPIELLIEEITSVLRK
ncbi:hypothetical protein N0O92_21430 [Alkalihalobacillus sp. MEB130]|uniref:hypothetical protein n=1 Tax=Alkalihalobacillus sp. MEB130 TaxID=2976704 RepID=UPI0028E0225B|nr:hypothetical protein [Alkalihalobacillus sp. MEB130]MDT8862756.1 hypothetical protein [Alkalihalobacillus sp. MEB130]